METLKINSRGESVRILQRMLHLFPDGIFGEITKEAVIAFQTSHGLVADGIVGQKTWNALCSDTLLKKSKRTIVEIIVHCTATAEGKDYTVNDIRKWHLQRGFSDIGYHYVVYRDGSVNVGRDVDVIGAHCTNHNAHSIGVCYVGGCAIDGKTPKDTRTQKQKDALMNLLSKLKHQYPTAKIYGHLDFANKACPSFDAKQEYANIK